MRRCATCGLEFASPMRGAPPEWYDALHEGVRWEFDEVLGRYPGEGRQLLDVGCGKGRFLDLARRHGYRVTGLDFSRACLAHARQRYGLSDLHEGTLAERLGAWHERFDVVTAFHVLEHVEDPLLFLAEVRSVLKRGGMVVVALPNPRRAFLRVRRENWDYPPHHLTRWTPESLRAVFSRAGLRMLDLREEPISLARLFRYPDAYRDFLYVAEGRLLDAAKRVAPLGFREVSRRREPGQGGSAPVMVLDLVRVPKLLVKSWFRLVGIAYGAWLVWRMRGAPALTLCAVAVRDV